MTQRRWICGLIVGSLTAAAPAATQSAIANGDTRTINLYHAHTHETIAATYLVNGQYDQAVLDKLNWFLRDWRRDEPTKMDPRLFDVVWEVHRESGSQQPIEVMSAYRSPQTNAMLRARSRGVAEHSQHILGKAMDQHYMDVPMSRIREIGMRLQRGGVGFYPTAGTPFVHLDVGGVRHWPRMSYDQLARLFPDGKTVHIPSNGQPLAHYEEARAELEGRGDTSYPTSNQLQGKGFFAWLFGRGGGGGDEEEDNESAGVKARKGAGANTRMAAVDPGRSSAALSVGNYGKAAQDRGAAVMMPSDPPRFSFFSQQPAPPAPAAPPPPSPAPAPPPVEPTVAVATEEPPKPVAVAVAPVLIPAMPVLDPRLAPLPPRRPTELATLGPVPPLPPSRPAGTGPGAAPHDAIAAGTPANGRDAIGSLLAASGTRIARLPDAIAPEPGPARVLGYAAQGGPADPPMPVARPSTLVSTRLDRSNFRSLTRPEPTAAVGGRSALGAALPPLRAAARADLGALAAGRSARPTSFQPKASDLSTDRFTGQVARPTTQARGDARRPTVD